jgi:predicted phage-related endonuclease
MVWSNDKTNDYNYINIKYGRADFEEALPRIEKMTAEQKRLEAIAEEEKAGAIDFWDNHVIPCIPPALTDVDADRLQKAKAEEVEHAEPIITDDEETVQILENYISLRTQISALEKLKKVTYAQLLDKLGTAQEMIAGEHSVSCSVSNRRTCDFDILQSKYPAIYDEVVSMSQSLRVNVK